MESTIQKAMPDRRRTGEYIGTVSTQGRVTIPEEVRQLLSIQPQDKLIFKVTENSVELTGKLPTLDELAGSIKPHTADTPIDEMVKQARSQQQPKRFISN